MILIISSSTIKINGGDYKVYELKTPAFKFPKVGDFYPTLVFVCINYFNLSKISF